MAADIELDERTAYEIRVRGELDARWGDWFGDLTVTVEREDPPLTRLVGPVDQAALRGILNRLWDLNLTLVSVAPHREDVRCGTEDVPRDREGDIPCHPHTSSH